MSKKSFKIGEEVTFKHVLCGEIHEVKDENNYVIKRDGRKYIIKKEDINRL